MASPILRNYEYLHRLEEIIYQDGGRFERIRDPHHLCHMPRSCFARNRPGPHVIIELPLEEITVQAVRDGLTHAEIEQSVVG